MKFGGRGDERCRIVPKCRLNGSHDLLVMTIEEDQKNVE